MIASTETVRDVALELPQTTGACEWLQIDSAGLNVDSVHERLASGGLHSNRELVDPQKCSLTGLISYIVDKHHSFTRKEMVRLESLIEEVSLAHTQNHPELTQIRILFEEICADLRPHMLREEQILFPHIVAMESAMNGKHPSPVAAFNSISKPIRMVTLEHDEAGAMFRQLRKFSSNYAVPADCCISFQMLYQGLEAFEYDLRQHIHLENNILFPRAFGLES
jgi:regulator of cell morphogenesis and NO signaling